jgi:hypothetical protein
MASRSAGSHSVRKRPASDDPLFSELWREVGSEDQIIGRTIKRWRSQGR